MNAFGQVAGLVRTGSGYFDYYAFFWNPVTEATQDLGTFGGTSSNAQALSNRGQVTGTANGHAFFWDPATDVMADLGTLGGANSSGADINEAGQIVGSAQMSPTVGNRPGIHRAFLWDPITREMQDLGSLNDRGSNATAINESGFVTGGSQSDRWEDGLGSTFVWNPNTRQMLEVPQFEASQPNFGLDINDAGQIMGLAQNPREGTLTAFRWNTSNNTVASGSLNPNGGHGSTHSSAMNEVGQITGVSEVRGTTPTVPTVAHAFFWDPTKSRITDLGVLDYPSNNFAAQYSEGIDINNVGEITGTSTTASDGVQHAFLWDGLKLRDLNALIAPDDPLIGLVTLEAGVAINDAGRILVWGVDNRTGEHRSYLLTPRTVPFARFKSRTNIDLRPVHGKDWFDTLAHFTLGADSNGIAPLKEPVTLQIGTFSTTIPARSFKLINGDFTFKGRINGVKLYARIRLIKGKRYEFFTYANCASLTGTSNPVRVALVIGDDSGGATVTAKFGPRPNKH